MDRPPVYKIPFQENFLGQVKPREGGSNLTPTVNDLKMCKYWQVNENNKDAFEEGKNQSLLRDKCKSDYLIYTYF